MGWNIGPDTDVPWIKGLVPSVRGINENINIYLPLESASSRGPSYPAQGRFRVLQSFSSTNLGWKMTLLGCLEFSKNSGSSVFVGRKRWLHPRVLVRWNTADRMGGMSELEG